MHFHFAIQFIEWKIINYIPFIPLSFFLSPNVGLSIPLIALYHNDLPLNIEFV
jgi:hypothetical protein